MGTHSKPCLTVLIRITITSYFVRFQTIPAGKQMLALRCAKYNVTDRFHIQIFLLRLQSVTIRLFIRINATKNEVYLKSFNV